jgi:hypothetical protein
MMDVLSVTQLAVNFYDFWPQRKLRWIYSIAMAFLSKLVIEKGFLFILSHPKRKNEDKFQTCLHRKMEFAIELPPAIHDRSLLYPPT